MNKTYFIKLTPLSKISAIFNEEFPIKLRHESAVLDTSMDNIINIEFTPLYLENEELFVVIRNILKNDI
jgi:hypothetical protein